MALSPPTDFAPPQVTQTEPTEEELRLLWRTRERARQERSRAVAWHGALERLRRGPGGSLRPAAPGAAVPDFAREPRSFGPDSRAGLRPVPRAGRVAGVGVDTISICWYAEPESALAGALRGLARLPTRGAWILPQAVGGFRVGWFPQSGLVFAEGHPRPGMLCAGEDLPAALGRLDDDLWDLGIPAAEVPSAGVRRLDVGADLICDSASEGLAFLECLASASFGSGRIVGYRTARVVESVVVKSGRGRTLARVYDKAREREASAERGRWLRLEAQWRFPHGSRPSLESLDSFFLRDRFKRRFRPVWQGAGGFALGGPELLAERVGEAVRSGRLRPSRARSVVGYLLLGSAGVEQGADRTVAELERECRELGVSFTLSEATERRFDLASLLDECLAPELWG